MPDHPQVRSHPPLVFLSVALITGLLRLAAPAQLGPSRRTRWLALPIIAAGVGVLGSAIRQMRRAGTNIPPDLPVTALVTSGPYRFTRNPIYMGLALVYSGLGLLLNTLWFLPGLLAYFAILQTRVVRYEESYLASKFGQAYRDYQARVHRWV